MKKKKKNNNNTYWFNNKNTQKMNSYSWFNINSIPNENYINSSNKNKPINKYLSCKKIELYPTKLQKDILLNWMNLFIDMYNASNYFINNNIYDFKNKKIKDNSKEILNFIRLRDKYIKDKKLELCQHKINKHLLDEAIKHNVSKHKTCQTNLFNKNIKFFRLKNMKKDRRKKILIIERGLFSKKINGFCSSVLGEIKSSEKIGVNKTSVLQYDKHLNKFNLYIPIERETTNKENRTKCGIDPGVRTFLTCYSEKEVLEIGEDCYKEYKKKYDKIDKLRELLSKKIIKLKNFRKSMNRLSDKIKNLTKDLHFKTSKYLCDKFDIITIGKISTKSIISNLNNLNKISKRSMLSLSHYKFREVLEYQCKKYNTKLNIVSEYNTTKQCSNCNTLNEVGNSKIFNCNNCNLKCDRDINSSINIYRK
jgi:transposase